MRYLTRDGELSGLGLKLRPIEPWPFGCRGRHDKVTDLAMRSNTSQQLHATLRLERGHIRSLEIGICNPARRCRPSVLKYSLRTCYAAPGPMHSSHIYLGIAMQRDFFRSSLKRVMRPVLNSTSGLTPTDLRKGQPHLINQKKISPRI